MSRLSGDTRRGDGISRVEVLGEEKQNCRAEIIGNCEREKKKMCKRERGREKKEKKHG